MKKIIQYLKDVQAELVKVNWPTRGEVSGATILVVVLSILLSIFVFGCDKLLMFVVGLFFENRM